MGPLLDMVISTAKHTNDQSNGQVMSHKRKNEKLSGFQVPNNAAAQHLAGCINRNGRDS